VLVLTLVGVWGAAMGIKWAGVYIAGLFAIAFAAIVGLCGRIWFLMIAYSEDSTTGTLCLMLWPYSIYFLLTNLEETWKPFAIEILGGILVSFSLCGGALREDDGFDPGNLGGPKAPAVNADDDKDDDPIPGMPPANPPGQPPRRKRRRLGRPYVATVARAKVRNSAANRFAVSSTSRHFLSQSAAEVPDAHGAELAST